MAVTAPPRPSDPRRPRRAGLGTGRGRRASSPTTSSAWIALAARPARARRSSALIAYTTTKNAWPWFREEGFGDLRRQLGPGEGPVRRRGDDLRHVPRRLHRARDLGAGQHRHRAVRHRDRAAAARASRSSTWSTCSPRSRRSSTGSGRSSCSRRTRWPTSTRASPTATSGIPIIGDAHRRSRARPGSSYMTAGLIVAIMITPIITSITREVFATTPRVAQGSGVRHGRDAVGDDPRRGVPAQPRWRRRRR